MRAGELAQRVGQQLLQRPASLRADTGAADAERQPQQVVLFTGARAHTLDIDRQRERVACGRHLPMVRIQRMQPRDVGQAVAVAAGQAALVRGGIIGDHGGWARCGRRGACRA
ncbi:hypothetical protein D3C71_1154950 [compost metagenome]